MEKTIIDAGSLLADNDPDEVNFFLMDVRLLDATNDYRPSPIPCLERVSDAERRANWGEVARAEAGLKHSGAKQRSHQMHERFKRKTHSK